MKTNNRNNVKEFIQVQLEANPNTYPEEIAVALNCSEGYVRRIRQQMNLSRKLPKRTYDQRMARRKLPS